MRIINDSRVNEGVLEIEIEKENDYSILRNYPSATKLVITNYIRLTSDIIKEIANNSDVTAVDANYSTLLNEKLAKEKGFTVLGWPYSDIKYNNISIQNIVMDYRCYDFYSFHSISSGLS